MPSTTPRTLALLATAALLAGCASGESDTKPTSGLADAVRAESGPAPTATDTAPALGTPTNPGSMTEHEFTYTSWDTTWRGTLTGLVEVETSQYALREGRCFVLLGEIAPIAASDNEPYVSGYSTPEFALVIDGKVVDEFEVCAAEALWDAQIPWRLELDLELDESAEFYDVLFVPADNTGDIEFVTVGLPTYGEALFFTPTYLDELPTGP